MRLRQGERRQEEGGREVDRQAGVKRERERWTTEEREREEGRRRREKRGLMFIALDRTVLGMTLDLTLQ